MRYFSLVDVDNKPFPGALFRYREENDLIHEEQLNIESKKWESTTYLTRMIVGGDSTVLQITEESARELENRFTRARNV